MNIKRLSSGSVYGLYLALLAVLSMVTSCATEADALGAGPCQTTATVRDLSGLDGCGYVLVLPDGTRLEPVLDEARQAPSIRGISLRDGMRVNLSYTLSNDRVSICMTGKIAEVTCFSEITGTDKK